MKLIKYNFFLTKFNKITNVLMNQLPSAALALPKLKSTFIKASNPQTLHVSALTVDIKAHLNITMIYD